MCYVKVDEYSFNERFDIICMLLMQCTRSIVSTGSINYCCLPVLTYLVHTAVYHFCHCCYSFVITESEFVSFYDEESVRILGVLCHVEADEYSRGPSTVRVCAKRFHPHYRRHPHYTNTGLDSAPTRIFEGSQPPIVNPQ